MGPSLVSALCGIHDSNVEQHDGGIVDKMSALYAAHPTLVKTLGSAATMIAMRKIAERHSNA